VTKGRRPPRRLLARPSIEVAPWLLGKVLAAGGRSGRIVEVEAYAGGDDPASHAHRGRTARNALMFERAGLLYVHFTYGMHWCANVVTGPVGEAQAVLIRALAPLTGLDAMREARPAARRDRELCSGPARLCQALGIDGAFAGVDLLVADAPVQLIDDGTPPPVEPGMSTRVGISRATERPWRWFVVGDPNLSA